MNIKDAIELTKQYHFGQLDKSGIDYWYHPLRVMLRLGPNATFIERCAALLHDVLEDTEVTVQDMIDDGFPEQSVEIVDFYLTRRPDVTYAQYIEKIYNEPSDAPRMCKFADLADNLSPGRSAKLPDHLKGINTRHIKARAKLQEQGDVFGIFDEIIEGDIPDEFLRPFLDDSVLGDMTDGTVKWELLIPLQHFNEFKYVKAV